MLLPDRAVTICLREPDPVSDVREAGEDGPCSAPEIALALLLANEEVFGRDLRAIHDRPTLEEEELGASFTGGRPGERIDQGRSLTNFDPALRSDGRMPDAVRDDGLFGPDEAMRGRNREGSRTER